MFRTNPTTYSLAHSNTHPIEIGSGGIMHNQPQGAQGSPLALAPVGQPQMRNGVQAQVVQAQAAPVQQPQIGVVVQGTVVKGP